MHALELALGLVEQQRSHLLEGRGLGLEFFRIINLLAGRAQCSDPGALGLEVGGVQC